MIIKQLTKVTRGKKHLSSAIKNNVTSVVTLFKIAL